MNFDSAADQLHRQEFSRADDCPRRADKATAAGGRQRQRHGEASPAPAQPSRNPRAQLQVRGAHDEEAARRITADTHDASATRCVLSLDCGQILRQAHG
jgi:hypothetical protein